MKDFRKIFKEEAQAKTLKSYHVIQRAILQSIEAAKVNGASLEVAACWADFIIRRAFTPVTRKIKLDNGREPYDAVNRALPSAKYDVMRFFEGTDIGLTEFVDYKIVLDFLEKKFDKPSNYNNRYYFYIFVRQDITPEYQTVQACHAAAKMGHYCHKFCTNINFDELYITLVGVSDIKGLETAIADIKEIGGVTYEFKEPDIGNELTAVASSPIKASDRKRLLSYKRLKFKYD